jgi:hypothetical protein
VPKIEVFSIVVRCPVSKPRRGDRRGTLRLMVSEAA